MGTAEPRSSDKDEVAASVAAEILRRAGELFDTDLDERDLDTAFVTEDGFELGGEPLDSVDLVEFLGLVEDALEVDLMKIDDISEVSTPMQLAKYAMERANDERIAAFLRSSTIDRAS